MGGLGGGDSAAGMVSEDAAVAVVDAEEHREEAPGAGDRRNLLPSPLRRPQGDLAPYQGGQIEAHALVS